MALANAKTLRLEYDATLEEIVDPNLRLTKRTAAYRRQRSRVKWCVGGALAVGVTVFPLVAERGVTSVVLGFLGLGVAPFFDRSVRRNTRPFLEEKYGSAPVHFETAIGPDGVRSKGRGLELAFDWQHSTGVEDAGDALELWFQTGVVVLRNRVFRSAEERREVYEYARARLKFLPETLGR